MTKNFDFLIKNISNTHTALQKQAANSVNQLLSIRNWLIGFYIVEYEQNGNDKADYGDKLLDEIASKLKAYKGIDKRSLFRYKSFYITYPQVSEFLLSNEVFNIDNPDLLNEIKKVGSLSPQLIGSYNELNNKEIEKVGSVTPQFVNRVPGKTIITKLSYTHIEVLLSIKDDLKRTFYEVECIKGVWSVRELKRQINSAYFERSGLSGKPEKLAELSNNNIEPAKPTDIIKNVYSFEFLDLNIKDAVEESDLESALLSQLQNFILELGNGFCFEARQKRILIGEKYYFIDLVFYHRILKCHVLLELKIGEFEHGDIGQLNTYINYFKEEIKTENDNQPIGILMVAEKDNTLVKYAKAGMDDNLFVQKYLMKLPSINQLQNYLQQELKKL